MARPATKHPSTSLCGSWRIISRSLHVPGSPSSALTTRYFGLSPPRPVAPPSTHDTPCAPQTTTRLPATGRLVHKAPLHPRGEPCATTPAEARLFDLAQNPLGAL